MAELGGRLVQQPCMPPWADARLPSCSLHRFGQSTSVEPGGSRVVLVMSAIGALTPLGCTVAGGCVLRAVHAMVRRTLVTCGFV